MFNKQGIPIVYWDLKGNFHLALTFNTIRHTIHVWSIVLIPCTYDHISPTQNIQIFSSISSTQHHIILERLKFMLKHIIQKCNDGSSIMLAKCALRINTRFRLMLIDQG